MNWSTLLKCLRWINGQRTFTAIALAMASLFAWGFFSQAGLPPTQVEKSWMILAFFLIFFLLPFAKRLDFFQFFTFEAKIEQVRKEVSEAGEKIADVKGDIRHVIAQQNALSATFQSLQNQAVTVNNNYSGVTQQQAEVAVAAVEDVEPVELPEADPLWKELSDEELFQEFSRITSDIDINSSDRTMKLADLFSNSDNYRELRRINLSESAALLRIRIEGELKRLIRPHAEASRNALFRAIRFSQRVLLKNAMEYHPELAKQRESFEVFFRIANLAIHADEVSVDDLETAIYLGQRLLGLLKKTEPVEPLQREFELRDRN